MIRGFYLRRLCLMSIKREKLKNVSFAPAPAVCRQHTFRGIRKSKKTCRFLKRNVYKHRKTRQMGLTNKKRYAIINTINYWYCFFTFAAFSALKWFCYSQMRDEKQRVMKSDIEIS